MAFSGVLGLHIIGDTGNSNENAVAAARELGGKYCTIVNADWKLYAPLLDSGIDVIGRWKSPSWDDDDADNHQSGKEWANFLHNVYPDTRIYLTAGNELGDGTPERTQAWMVAFVEEAARLGHRTAGYHSHFLSPYRGYWATQKRALDALRAHDGVACVHKGFAAAFRDMPALRGQRAIDEDFSRILEIQQYGVPVVVTEYTGSFAPDRGWMFLYRDSAGNIRVDEALAEAELGLAWLAAHGCYATYFTWWKWHNGEGFELAGDEQHKRTFRAGLKALNAKYPVKEGAPVTQYPFPITGGERVALAEVPNKVSVNIRAQPNPASASSNSSADAGDAVPGDEYTWYPGAKIGDWVAVEPLNQVTRQPGQQAAAKGWVSLQGGAVKFVEALLPEAPTMVEVPQALIDRLHQKFAEIEALRKELPPSASGTF